MVPAPITAALRIGNSAVSLGIPGILVTVRSPKKAWIKPLEFQNFENGVLHLRAGNKFIADYVESHYQPQIVEAWESFGHTVKGVRLETRATVAA